MQKPYIKKYDEIGKFAVWIVDGKYIRGNLDKEFVNFAQRSSEFKYIPENEFWIDKEHSEGEMRFFIHHLLAENKLLENGADPREARLAANEKERKEREKSRKYKENFKKFQNNPEDLIKRIHKDLLQIYSKNIEVWIVDGELVRDFFFIDFTEGGHDLVYPFVPKEEVWIDDDVSQKERKFILLHELYERYLMSQEKMDYDSAHLKASRLEYQCRHNPERIGGHLKKYM